MDFATIIGLLLALAALTLSAVIGGVDARIIFARYEAFLLVFLGSAGATLVSFPLKTFLRGFTLGLRTAFTEPVYHEREVIATLVSFAEKARREGLLALENEASALEDDFMRKGIQLVIDGRDTDIIRKILETEIQFVQERNTKAEAVFMTMGGFSPTLGIIGTVLGLIAMLKALGSLSGSTNIAGELGVATAQAFVATFFGIALANLVWIPLASKIKERAGEQLLLREIMIEGILSIQAGDNPRLLEEKLHAFLDPNERETEVEAGGGVGEAGEPEPEFVGA
ncbi:MAG TPA: MotA/TolQ/ExbB proton channel family protein [Candidatus Elarobacter sp.]|nr:MotA/TolQ/ExbB proton channel family protein [Candidatus Elarobacter sp.]